MVCTIFSNVEGPRGNSRLCVKVSGFADGQGGFDCRVTDPYCPKRLSCFGNKQKVGPKLEVWYNGIRTLLLA